ncbi:MAG TPA: hypothetical protein VEU08_08360 [Vicinamibacterales bacterium]|nr:hypothetical protein [Vicinamibacterales bacterium]
MDGKSAQTSKRPSGERRRRAIIIAGIAILVIATVVFARYAASRAAARAAAAKKPQAELQLAPDAKPTSETPQTRVRGASEAPQTHSAGQPAHARTVKAAAQKPRPAAVAENAGPTAPAATKTTAPAPAAAKTAAIAPTPSEIGQAPVTITGCLETTVEENEFRLTDTSGADAPKARSWKSGFLKKSAAPVALVDYSDASGLKKLVGRRVVATGVLTSNELRVRSFKPAGASCTN